MDINPELKIPSNVPSLTVPPACEQSYLFQGVPPGIEEADDSDSDDGLPPPIAQTNAL